MIVAIDGPAGSGKSTVARQLAERLGFEFLDTGAMYRAVAWAAREQSVDLRDAPQREAFFCNFRLGLNDGRVVVNGRDVTREIRSSEATSAVKRVADLREVREKLVELQRARAQGRNLVSEGRDQGTLVFPHAECKFFLTASPEVRARRRTADLVRRGEQVSEAEVLAAQNQRDADDARRPYGRLAKAPDAEEIDTTELDLADVLDRLESLVRERMTVA